MQNNNDIIKSAVIGGIINGIINGAIYWFQVKGQEMVLLTDNQISSTEHTVFSGAVMLATSLAFILTTIAFFTFKKEGKPRYFPKVFLQALKNAIFAFGGVTVAGVLIQRWTGSIEVTPVVATVITGLIACLVGGTVDYLTKKDL